MEKAGYIRPLLEIRISMRHYVSCVPHILHNLLHMPFILCLYLQLFRCKAARYALNFTHQLQGPSSRSTLNNHADTRSLVVRHQGERRIALLGGQKYVCILESADIRRAQWTGAKSGTNQSRWRKVVSQCRCENGNIIAFHLLDDCVRCSRTFLATSSPGNGQRRTSTRIHRQSRKLRPELSPCKQDEQMSCSVRA